MLCFKMSELFHILSHSNHNSKFISCDRLTKSKILLSVQIFKVHSDLKSVTYT